MPVWDSCGVFKQRQHVFVWTCLSVQPPSHMIVFPPWTIITAKNSQKMIFCFFFLPPVMLHCSQLHSVARSPPVCLSLAQSPSQTAQQSVKLGTTVIKQYFNSLPPGRNHPGLQRCHALCLLRQPTYVCVHELSWAKGICAALYITVLPLTAEGEFSRRKPIKVALWDTKFTNRCIETSRD